MPVLEAEFILAFKAKAWLDLTDRKMAGEQVNGKAIKKHRNDVFRLSVLLSPTQKVNVADSIKQDMNNFLTSMVNEKGINLKDFGITVGLDKLLADLRSIYQVDG